MRRICSDAALYEGYQSLFDIGYESVDDLKSQYAEAFGDTFNVIDPTLDALFSAVAVSEQTRNLDAQKGICDSQAFVNAMTLDMVCSRLSNPLSLCTSSAAPCVWTSCFGDIQSSTFQCIQFFCAINLLEVLGQLSSLRI